MPADSAARRGMTAKSRRLPAFPERLLPQTGGANRAAYAPHYLLAKDRAIRARINTADLIFALVVEEVP
jgi:hypothetical protein